MALRNLSFLKRWSLLKASFETRRNYAANPKKFYKKAGILYCDGQYEITLDQRKLKTPTGKVFKLPSELLALAVAQEWNSQKEEIRRSNMHLTALCNTAMENPNHLSKEDVMSSIINFLETDTVLYHSHDDDVYELQKKEWKPTIEWFCDRYDVNITETRDLIGPVFAQEDKDKLKRHLLSYNMAALHGLFFAVETLKSLVLTLCCIDRKLTPDQAVLLSRLEEEFQADRWGRVQWAHDISHVDSISRLSAAVIFVQLNSMSEETTSKLVSNK